MKGKINKEWISNNFIPFVPSKRLSLCVSDQDIDDTLLCLLNETKVEDEKKEDYMHMSRKDKIILLKNQEKADQSIPSPEWIVNLVSVDCCKTCLKYIISSFINSRISWSQRFIDSGGHIVLFRELASRSSYCSFFSNSFPYSNKRIHDIIKTLKIVICYLDKEMIIPKNCIEIVVQSFDKFNFEQFKEAVSLLYIIADLQNGAENIIDAFRKLPEISGYVLPFKIFSDVIETDPVHASKGLFYKLIYKLYVNVQKNYVKRIMLSFDYVVCGLINVLKNLSGKEKKMFDSTLPSFINQIDSDLINIASLFDGKPFKCLSEQNFLDVLIKSSLTGPVLVNLLSIYKNQKEFFNKLMIFLYHFLTCFRKHIVVGKEDFIDASTISFKSTIKEEKRNPKLTPNISNNECYKHLFKNYKYISDGDLKQLNYKAIEENDNKVDNNLIIITELQKKLSESSKEIEQLKQELDERKKNEEPKIIEKEVVINNANQNKLEEVQTEIEKLRANQLRILELAKFIPTEIKTFQNSQLNVLPKDAVDMNEVKKKFEEIKKSFKEGQDINTLLDDFSNQLNRINNERNQIENNAKALIRIIQKDNDNMKNEMNQIKSFKSEIINGITEGFDNDKEEEENDEVPLQDNNQTNNEIIIIPYEKLNDGCSKSKRWKEALNSLINVNENEILKYFTNEVGENKLLSEIVTKRYQKLIKNLSIPTETIIQHIDQELFKISENNLRYLLRISISKQEIINLKNFNGDIGTLNEEERFGVLLYRVKNWRDKVKNMIELHNFDDEMSVIINNIEKYSTALKKIKTSKLLPQIFGTIISIANYMNGGSEYGGASSFSLLDLKEFKFIKSNKKGISFINYIVGVLERNHINVQSIQNEMRSLQVVSRVDLNYLGERLRNSQISLARRKRTRFVNGASSRIHHTLELYNNLMDQYNQLSNGYGINAAPLKEPNLIPILLDFSSDLIKAIKENKAQSFITE